MCFRMNSRVVRFLERRKKKSSTLKNGAANNADLDDGCDATAVLLKKGGRQAAAILDLHWWSKEFIILFLSRVKKFV